MIKKIGIFLILATLILPTMVALAADDLSYTVLAPLPGVGDDGGKTTLVEYVPAIFKLAIGLSAVAAVLMIVLGGFQYISSDALMKKNEGRERIKNAVFGLVLVISAWLILNTINPNLLNINLNIESISTTAAPTGALTGPNGDRKATGADLLSGASLEADQNVREQILASWTKTDGGVTVNNPPCSAQRPSNCTNVNGIPSSMISSLIDLQKSCLAGRASCSVVITGGTETSLHTTGTAHKPGNAVVDLGSTATLNSYLGNTSPKSGDIVEKNGLKFVYEVAGDNKGVSTGAHWHVVVKR